MSLQINEIKQNNILEKNSNYTIPEQTDPSIFQKMPVEIVVRILNFLPPEDLAKSASVCREWQLIASDKSLWNGFDLKKIFKSVNIIDENVWEKYVRLDHFKLSAKNNLALDNRILIPIIKSLSKQVEGQAGVTILTMPKDLTLNKMISIAESAKQGNATRVKYVWDDAVKEFGNLQVEQTYTVVITNSVLNGSRGLVVNDQRELVNKFGCELPTTLELTTLALLTYITSSELPPTRLFPDKPLTFSRTSEQIKAYPMIAGRYEERGFTIFDDPSVNFKDPSRGAAARRVIA